MNEKTLTDAARVAIMYIGSLAGTLFTRVDELTWTLIGFMTADYITGMVCAFCSKSLSSKVGAKGIAKKFAILCIVAVSAAMGSTILGTGALGSAVTLYYISNEGLSIIENCVKIGIPVPAALKRAITNICSEADGKGQTKDKGK